VRDLAWRHGFPTSLVNLSPKECPYDDPVKVYASVALALSSPPVSDEAETTRGLPDLLRDVIDDKRQALGEERTLQWIERSVARIPVESHSFRRAVTVFMSAYHASRANEEAVLEPWLLGEPVPVQETRPLGIYEAIEPATGFKMLRSLAQVVHGIGLPGLVLLFDEVDRNLSLTSRKMHAVGDNLRQVIDLCGQARLPATLFLYAVPPEFMRNVVPEYPALEQRLKSPAPLSVRSPQAAVIDLEKLDMEPAELLVAIGDRLLEVFARAHDWEVDAAIQAHNLALLAGAMAMYTFEVSHRRLFVKSYVDFLYRQRTEGQQRLSADDAAAVTQGSYEEFVGVDDEEFVDA
jgi:hypothetical protein